MRRIQIISAAAGILLLAACSSGPRPPQPGTPEFAWGAAKSTYASGDYLKCLDNLSQLAKGDSEFAAKAKPLAIVLSAGVAKAYTDLAQNFEYGAQANRANPAPFRKQMNFFRSQAASTAVQTV